MRSTRTRFATGLALIPVVLVFLVIASSSAFGKPSAAQAQYKVTICHKTHSATNPQVTITVGAKAAAKHVTKHGDTLGPCAPTAAPTAASSEAGAQGNGKAKGKSK
jgi:hypothetical protein